MLRCTECAPAPICCAQARALLKEMTSFITIAGAHVPWSPHERKAELSKLYALTRRFGPASCFLSVAPDDVHHPTVLRLCYKSVGANEFPSQPAELLDLLRRAEARPKRRAVSVLKWAAVGTERPAAGNELRNERLSSVLPLQVDFSKEELAVLGVKGLRATHYVKAGDAYFVPVDERTESDRLDDKVNEELDAALENFNQRVREVGALPNEEFEFQLNEALQQKLAALNPVATTLFFEQLSEAIFTHLIGMPPTGKRKASARAATRARGVLGRCFAWASVIETNKRKSLHFHASIYGGAAPALLANVAGHAELEALVVQALDSMYSAEADLDLHALDVARKQLNVRMVRCRELDRRGLG